jgi:3-oxoacyl-[acyl-carrier protein] reductase
MRLKDRVALVTGGSRGIGRAIAESFAAEGARVAVVYNASRGEADALARTITAAGGAVLTLQADVTDSCAAQRCVDRVEEEWGRLDILVNSAGIIQDDLFLRMEPQAWDRVLSTNLGGTINFCRAAGLTMLRQRRGRIINLSSVAANYVAEGQTNYSASKGAINAFTRALALEMAHRNVTVNAIAPGFIATDMTAAIRGKSPDLLNKAIPLRRVGQPGDVAAVAVFLAGDESTYMTGQVLTIDGGLSLGGNRG